MRISDVSNGYTTLRQLQSLQNLQQTQQQQLVTGRRVNNLEDNPATAADVIQGRATQDTLIQMRDNSARAANISQSGIDTLDYLKQVAGQAQAMIDDTSLRGSSAVEQLDAMIGDVVSAANTQYNGDYLFGGNASAVTPFTLDSATGHYVYNGSGDGRTFDISDGVSLTPFTGDTTNQGIRDFLNTLVDLRSSLSTNDPTGLANASQGILSSEDKLLDGQSALGMKQFRIEVLKSRDTAKYAAIDQDNTTATAADQTETIVNLLNTQKAFQGALQSVSKINDLSLLNYV